MRATLLLAVLLAVVVSAPANVSLHAQADGDLSVSVVAVDDSQFPLVRVVLTAQQLGRPIASVATGELSVVESGVPATVLSVERAVDASAPLGLVLVLDVSASVEGEKLRQAQAAATSLLESLNPGDAAAVVTFASEVSVVQELSVEREPAIAAIAALRASGNTALYEAVERSARLAADSDLTRRAVVLLTDGQNFGDQPAVSRAESVAFAAQSPAVFYVVGVGPNIDRLYLEEIAAASGGQFFHAEGAADVAAIYTSLEERLRSQFVVTVESTAPAASQARSIEVTLERGASIATAATSYESLRPQAAPPPEPTAEAQPAPVAPAATAPPITAAQAPATPAPAASGGIPAAAIAAGALLLVVAGGVFAWARRRGRVTTIPDSFPTAMKAITRAALEPQHRRDIVVTVPGERSVSFELRGEPVTLGSAEGCAIRLPATLGVAPEHARLWLRDGQPMLHHLASGYVTKLNDRSVEWASMKDGDELRIGSVAITIGLPDVAEEGSPALAGDRRGA